MMRGETIEVELAMPCWTWRPHDRASHLLSMIAKLATKLQDRGASSRKAGARLLVGMRGGLALVVTGGPEDACLDCPLKVECGRC